ncbi:SpoIIE family protein phosphatase [Opitutus sp. ER46]|uniref:SpoIIE family protein phosphatase n=1 Tax=Opitutus sp. ER46 TaxID=2161864 RepID=UPI000D31DCBD|nr:SpoIIE family protein phosphatase [Opitutus sp. ER46]PTX94597.1 hypothetical protein DB354_12760 [Opitutus sp. ER46]
MPNLNVLVVDDEAEILETMKVFLRQRGDNCTTCSSGPEALQVMHDRIFDVMLSDIRMPCMDGLELVRRGKLLQPHTACILMSGAGSRGDIIAALKAGVFDFVDKPFSSLPELTMLLERAAESSRTARERDALLENLKEQNTQLEFSLLRLHEAFGRLREQEEALESDLFKAQLVQRRFLPPGFPMLPGLDLYGHFEPCEHLGGDFFGTLALPDGRLGLYLLDVAGHGVSAAMLTVTLREFLRAPQRHASAADLQSAPDQMLAYLNDTLRAEAFDPPVFATMLYAVLDPQTGEVRLAAAGHPPPLLLSAAGEPRSVSVHGPVLGGRAGARYQVTTWTLEPGDTMLLYSDGLTEARDATGREFGIDTLQHVLMHNHRRPAIELGEGVESALHEHLRGATAADDVTFLVVRRPAAVPTATVPAPGGASRLAPGSVRVVPPRTLRHVPPDTGGRIAGGWHGESCIIRLRGVGNWQLATTFREMFIKARERTQDRVAIDLAQCQLLDSTMLGVLLQHAANLVLHQPGLRVVEQLREIDVADQFTLSHEPCPPMQAPIAIEPMDTKQPCSELILSAHQALMDASSRNYQRFGAVVAALRPSEDSDT